MRQQFVISLLLLLISALTAPTFPSTSPTHPSDSYALKKLKNALVPSSVHSTALADWEYQKPYCSFSGVACNTHGRVISIHLVSLPLSGGSLPSELALLGALQNLTIANCKINSTIPHSISTLRMLRVLNLSANHLSGPFPTPSLINSSYFPLLQHVDLDSNNLSGILPPFSATQAHLRLIDLSFNFFSGVIPDSYGEMVDMLYIDFHNNLLSGRIPASLGSLKNLRVLMLGANPIVGEIPRTLGNLTSLEYLGFWNCNLVGSIPQEIGKLRHLRNVTLQSNFLSGSIPPNIGFLDNLTLLDLSNNRRTGQVPRTFRNLINIDSIYLQSNYLSGGLEAFRGYFPRLTMLALKRNRFTGNIPAELGNNTNLTFLHLAGNNLSGPIPPQICTRTKMLLYLDLGSNNLSGSIPESLGHCKSLGFITLNNNHLSGTVPAGLFNLPMAWMLDLSNNHLTGQLPDLVVGVKLQDLHLANNSFSGSIPPSIGNQTKLQRLSLQMNSFSGALPRQIGMLNLMLFNASNNALTGAIPWQLTNCTLLATLDLSHNNLSGEIPDRIKTLEKLTDLNLSFNRLRGEPPNLCQGNKTNMSFIDLSNNLLSGSVPECFRNRKEKPWFDGNAAMCGYPLPTPCQTEKPQHSSKKKLLWLLLLPVPLLLIAAICALTRRTRSNPDYWKMVLFDQSVNISVEEVVRCIHEENIIGRGGEGTVYRGSMNCGIELAIKLLREGRRHGRGLLNAEVKTLRRIRHRNIVKLFGYASNLKMDVLLYEYMPNGSLYQRIHSDDAAQFTWKDRVKVAVEVARALSHMHHNSSPMAIHRDVKSKNILLDSAFEAHLADFGLATFIDGRAHSSRRARLGTFAYMPPEYGNSRVYDRKGDVYSFGVVLLELITGNRAVHDSMSLREWIMEQSNLYGSDTRAVALAVADSRLPPPEPVQLIIDLYMVAMACVEIEKRNRPAMLEVLRVLSRIDLGN